MTVPNDYTPPEPVNRLQVANEDKLRGETANSIPSFISSGDGLTSATPPATITFTSKLTDANEGTLFHLAKQYGYELYKDGKKVEW